ncbi:MAG: hypothetical protein MI723_18470, partial [Caulobacterales bacterium]|nr:hypothetical protein [Caulobacterales bacterium]
MNGKRTATRGGGATRLALMAGVTALTALCPSAVRGQEADEANEEGVDVITVRGSRLPADLSSIPGSVTVISTEELVEQNAISTDLGKTLSYSVPGFAPSSKDGNNFAQTLRG